MKNQSNILRIVASFLCENSVQVTNFTIDEYNPDVIYISESPTFYKCFFTIFMTYLPNSFLNTRYLMA